MRSLQRERGVAIGFVAEGYVIHDDEFFERFGDLFAGHCVRDAEQAVGLGLRFDFGKDAALWVQEKRDVALAGLKVFDVVGEDGVEVAGAVGASKREVGDIIFVDEGDGVFCDFVFVLPVAEVVGESAAEPSGDDCAGGFVELG